MLLVSWKSHSFDLPKSVRGFTKTISLGAEPSTFSPPVANRRKTPCDIFTLDNKSHYQSFKSAGGDRRSSRARPLSMARRHGGPFQILQGPIQNGGFRDARLLSLDLWCWTLLEDEPALLTTVTSAERREATQSRTRNVFTTLSFR